MTDKYIKALARHERSQQEVRRLKMAIGESIAKCPVDVSVMKMCVGVDALLDDKGRTKTHIWHALRKVVDDGPQNHRLLTSSEITAYLADTETGCQHCHEAWRLIQQRKAARQELGIAKRSIRRLGKSAINACD